MGIVAVSNFSGDKTPMRFYIHGTGLEVFERKAREYLRGRPEQAAERFLLDSLEVHNPRFSDWDYVLGVVWADPASGMRTIDIFGYSDIREWPGNPEVNMACIKEGQWRDELVSCGDTLIVLGKEEEFRRGTKSLGGYFESWPDKNILEVQTLRQKTL